MYAPFRALELLFENVRLENKNVIKCRSREIVCKFLLIIYITAVSVRDMINDTWHRKYHELKIVFTIFIKLSTTNIITLKTFATV